MQTKSAAETAAGFAATTSADKEGSPTKKKKKKGKAKKGVPRGAGTRRYCPIAEACHDCPTIDTRHYCPKPGGSPEPGSPGKRKKKKEEAAPEPEPEPEVFEVLGPLLTLRLADNPVLRSGDEPWNHKSDSAGGVGCFEVFCDALAGLRLTALDLRQTWLGPRAAALLATAFQPGGALTGLKVW